MSRTYLQHPFFKNPVKWLRGVKKRHSPQLCLDGFYDTTSLNVNPFAKSLLETRLDVSRTRFPLENMVQIIVSESEKHGAYELVPVLQKPTCGQNPASYVINNKSYIKFLSRKRFAPIPLKYKHKSSSVIGAIKPPQDLATDIDSLYRSKIKKMIDELPENISVSSKDPEREILIRPAASDCIIWDDSLPVIYSSLAAKEIVLAYAEQHEVISLLLKLVASQRI
ncbi:hypothetical protein METBIDRAFT_36893 [Metschnikowia bicuspidata var. bicuspidata NRRL YB-4993]|uniref:Required for respiratory growth protein 8, mitochondrial n=1 Tax=Metschnikowia bicuspidata var. bicuspidata NRRL YB-4993 TaxID=869754 RepID=A0A1A0HJ99_9ASCO|nr:hypothetical protein METBIDRAFT_36893 [Metschnikowia bicuspidata var. bicuspidata NRRL YB-4993]OBA23962.1 hypothetical protein METBIDRAFT_36893 [Metschnikowia bicuspidata var. bicuspidata NRRL YB-4993]